MVVIGRQRHTDLLGNDGINLSGDDMSKAMAGISARRHPDKQFIELAPVPYQPVQLAERA